MTQRNNLHVFVSRGIPFLRKKVLENVSKIKPTVKAPCHRPSISVARSLDRKRSSFFPRCSRLRRSPLIRVLLVYCDSKETARNLLSPGHGLLIQSCFNLTTAVINCQSPSTSVRSFHGAVGERSVIPFFMDFLVPIFHKIGGI